MSQFINVGCYIDGVRPKSKKAIKDALKAIVNGEREPSSIAFDATDMFANAGKRFHAYVQSDGEYPDGIKPGYSYQVCGPDPYTKRNFYGTVSVNSRGVIVCS